MPGLADYRKQAGARARWKGYCKRKAGRRRYRQLVKRLASLQYGLCGYCEINLREGDRQVEHVVPQSHPKDGTHRALDATNLIACCQGGSSDDTSIRDDDQRFPGGSCGLAKGSNADPDFVDPRTLPDLPSLTRVRPDGRIEADTDACAAADWSADRVEKTIRILGLNVQRLQTARKDYWSNLSNKMSAYRDNPDAAESWARSRLLPRNGGLSKFFTTNRSYFGELGERILAKEPCDWI